MRALPASIAALLLGTVLSGCQEVLEECFEPLGMKEFTAEPIAQTGEGLLVVIHWNTSFETENEGGCSLYRRGADSLEVPIKTDGDFDGNVVDLIHESVVYGVDCDQICGEDLEREIEFDYSPYE